MPHQAQAILSFWFGPRPYTTAGVRQHSRLWFGAQDSPELIPQTDELIRDGFADMVSAAEHGELRAWESSPRRRLALILLFDQFARHVYRGTARAFAHDAEAQSLTLSGMHSGADGTLDPLERLFFYMPLQHAERLELQDESVAAFGRLLGECDAEWRPFFENARNSATHHHDIIGRFGRFPHRNRALGRDSTAAEQAWLASTDERFGQ